jgi:hypothetical protein
MKNNEENKLIDIWETPEITVLNVNRDTENGASPGPDMFSLS